MLDDADAKAGQIIVAIGVEARHLRCFAPGKGASRLLAAAGDTPDDARRDIHIEATGCVVVKEKKGFGAGYEHIVSAHGHEILADAVVFVIVDGELELGTDTVGAGGEYGPCVARRNLGQGREATETLQCLGPVGCFARAGDARYEFIAGVDIDTCCSIR